MRILVLSHEFPPIGGGGGRVAQDISKGLAQQGDEVVLITAHLKGGAREEHIDGIHIIRVPSLRRKSYQADLLAMGGYVLAGIWAGFRLTRRWRPDLIHVHFAVPAGLIAWFLSLFFDIPYILTAHLGDVPGGAPEKTARWFRWIFPFTGMIWRKAARVIAVSQFTRQLALKNYPVDVQVIHNGVNLEDLAPKEISVNSPPQIVFAGRFMQQKNPLQIIRTLAEIQDLSWHCVMLGDGPLLNATRAEIERYGLQERFTLAGWVSPEDVIDSFSKSDILFMPSLSEGLPVVGVQALAMGLAMVVSDIGGFIDLVDSGKNGFLIKKENTEEFGQRLTELLTDHEKLEAFRKASRIKAQDFNINYIVQQYQDVFAEIL